MLSNPANAWRGRCCDVLPPWVGTPLASPVSPCPGPGSRQRSRSPQRPRHGLRTPGSGASRRRLRGRSRRVSRARGGAGGGDAAAPAAPPAATAVWAPSRCLLARRLRAGAPRGKCWGLRLGGRSRRRQRGRRRWGGGLGTGIKAFAERPGHTWGGGGARSTAACRGRRRALPCAGRRAAVSPMRWHPRIRSGSRDAESRGGWGNARLARRSPCVVLFVKILGSCRCPFWKVGDEDREHRVEFLSRPFTRLGRPSCFLGEEWEGGRSTWCCGQRCLEADAAVGWGKGASSAVSWHRRAFCFCWPDKPPLLSSL